MPEIDVSQETVSCWEAETLVHEYCSLKQYGTRRVLMALVIRNILVCNWTIFPSVNSML